MSMSWTLADRSPFVKQPDKHGWNIELQRLSAKLPLEGAQRRSPYSFKPCLSGCLPWGGAAGFIRVHNLAWLFKFLRHWGQVAFRDAGSATFGWASIFGGALGAVLLRSAGFSMSPAPQWYDILVASFTGAGAGWVFGFIVNLIFFAPRKAYKIMKPFSLSLRDVISVPPNKQFMTYRTELVVYNRSSRYLIDCHTYITDISGTDVNQYHRFVETFLLPPYETKYVGIASWTARGDNNDDLNIQISGPVSAGLGGNVLYLPASAEYLITLMVRTPDSRQKTIRGRIGVKERKLYVGASKSGELPE
jgi:hypothetical protein